MIEDITTEEVVNCGASDIPPAGTIAMSEDDVETVYPDNWPSAIEQQIAELKAQLAATDYKVVKCSEAQLAGEELPYDIFALHVERQAIRGQINELEEQSSAVTTTE